MLESLTLGVEPDNRVDHRPDIPERPGLWWRYDTICYLGEIPRMDYVSATAWPYLVVRESEASVWVDYFGSSKRIGKNWGRKWAYPTKAEAWVAWKARFRWRKVFHEREARRIAALEKLLMAGRG